MNEENSSRLLVLRFSALGDIAIAIPVLLALKRTYPGASILFAAKSSYCIVPERLPGITVVPADTNGRHKGITGIYRLRNDLSKLNPSAIADLHAVLRTRILRLFFTFSGLRMAILNKGRQEKKQLTRIKNKTWKPLRSTHERYADVFRALGYPIELKTTDVLPRESWPKGLALPSPAANKKLIGIAPFAAHPGKCYPADLMKEVIRGLASRTSAICYLFGGGPKESRELQKWEAELPQSICVAGRGTLNEELALISNLDLMVSMDSGNGHLAAMYGIRVITLWGVTHPYAGFSPYAQPGSNSILSDGERFPLIPTSVYGNKVPQGYGDVMRSIRPADVVDKILEALQ